MTLKPLFDKVVLKAKEADDKTASGIFIASASKEKPQMATVVAVGPGGIIDGKEVFMQVKIGDEVLYSKYAGSDFKLDGEEVTVVRQSDILAIVIK
ncbi:MAG: co-chaperone GroES [Clostridiaceae bacterium]|jgi:chaperonin GroES|nr:co-chaperone GroES [Clostridiaceae bacterium]